MHVPPSVGRVEAGLRRRLESVQEWVQRTILWRVWERLLENDFVDRSVALGAKAFVSLFPAVIVVAAFLPSSLRNSVISTVTHRAGLDGASTVKAAFAGSDNIRRATGALGLVFTFFYINSFVTALQRVYLRAWKRPKVSRAYGYAMGAGWLVAIVAYLSLLGGARVLLGSGPKTLVFGVVAWIATMVIWTLTPWLMLQRQVPLRPVIPSGLVTGTGLAAYAATAALWMPNTVNQNQRQFGLFGIALALVTWMTGASTIVVIGACVGPVLADDTGFLGRLVRGPDAAPPGMDAPAEPVPAAAPALASASLTTRTPVNGNGSDTQSRQLE